jgi:hypothetical protein
MGESIFDWIDEWMDGYVTDFWVIRMLFIQEKLYKVERVGKMMSNR